MNSTSGLIRIKPTYPCILISQLLSKFKQLYRFESGCANTTSIQECSSKHERCCEGRTQLKSWNATEVCFGLTIVAQFNAQNKKQIVP